MISKGLLVFGLLAAFACQVSNAESVNTLEHLNAHTARGIIGDLIDQIREVIRSLEELLGGVIADALATLGNLASVVQRIKEEFLDNGIAVIANIVGEVTEFIANVTLEAAKLGIDITVCIAGRTEQVVQLKLGLVANLTGCAGKAAREVVEMVNNEIDVVNQMVRNITRLPVDLSKCLITLRPITCLLNLLADASQMLLRLPGQIVEIVEHALDLVRNLPINLALCLADIVASARDQTQQIIQDIGECVDDAISQATTTAAPTTAAPTTAAPTTSEASTTSAPATTLAP